MNKRTSKNLRNALKPSTRPIQVSPRKKVAWRLIRKWFNRYEKPSLIGMHIIATSQDGMAHISGCITNVRILKGGGHTRAYDIQAKPLNALKEIEVKKDDVY